VRAVPVAIPIGAEANFKGLADLLSLKAYTFAADESGKMTEGPIPADLEEAVAEAREKLIEAIAEADDALLERYLDGQELQAEDLAGGLRAAVAKGVFLPVLPVSAAKNMGAQVLLDLIVATLPSPLDRGAVSAKAPDGQEAACPPDPAGPFCGLVFKTVADPYAGRLSVIRIFSGSLSSDSTVYNVNKETKERFGALFLPRGKGQGNVEGAAGPGAIVAVAKLKETVTGNTLCADKPGLILPRLDPLPPVISYAVEAKSKGDEEKVFAGITRLLEEDETLKLTRDAQTRDMILAGMGQVHLEVTLEKLKRKFGGEVVLKTPKVPYLETIKKRVTDIQGKYKKQTGGRGQYGDAVINMEPLPAGSGFVFEDKIVGGVIPRQFIPAVEKGIAERCPQGILAGFPLVDFKVQLIFGSYHDVDSSEMAFKVAGSLAFQKAALAAQPTLLEPIMSMEIIVPEEFMGDIIGDLNSRRGRVLGMEAKGHNQVIKAIVPMAEVLRYMPDLKSMTGARGSFSLTMDHYEEVPLQLQEKIIAEAKAAAEQK
jgi:elongation factor G